ncbi:MAG: PLDc N-terminal domain-containing protein [Bacteroidales bacterium]|nr:PLDc N-terminal domain-containing protein [Bacteroidales bacterium]
MLATIVYVVGLLAAIWCVIDIFKKPKVNPLFKILLAVAVLAFSWIGLLVYYFLIRDRI